METIETIINGYRARMQQADRALDSLQRRIYRISTLRLLLFAAGVAGLIVLRSESWTVLAGIALVTFVPFVGLIQYHNRLFARKDYLEKEREVNRQEAAALADYDTSAFDDGQDFADPAHLYTFDLDVFGPRSLFQYLNRTCTQPGKTAWPPGWASTWRIRPPSRPGRRPCANWQRPPASANASAYWDCYTRARRPTKANCAPGQPRLPPSATTRC